MRQLHEVLDKILEVAPDLKDRLASTRQSCVYQPPEAQPELWSRAALILNQCAVEHPKAEEIKAIFNGSPVVV
jgi:hypothetical protein